MEEPQEQQLNKKKKEESDQKKKKMGAEEDTSLLDGFPSITHTTTRVFWNSRKRSANGQRIQKESEDGPKTPSNKQGQGQEQEQEQEDTMNVDNGQESLAVLSERRKALFEPLEPTMGMNGRNFSAEVLLPPPDFDAASYPKGWLIGKKRKLVNVDVVESMRRIAVQEMNRKDREIDGLNEQLEEDARALEHLQLQLLQERSKRTDVERENTLLQNQISMLMNMLNEGDDGADEGTDDS